MTLENESDTLTKKSATLYVRRRDARKHGKHVLIGVTIVAVALVFFKKSINLEEPFLFSIAWYGAIGLGYAAFLWHCAFCIRRGGEWRWELTEDSVILDSPHPALGDIGTIPLNEIATLLCEVRPSGEDLNRSYYIIDTRSKKWWLSSNAGFDPIDFFWEIQARRPVRIVGSSGEDA